jgi:hypothetical protein
LTFQIADEANDEPTCDLLTQKMQVSEKTAWMLRSLLNPPDCRTHEGCSPGDGLGEGARHSNL